jgi:hypothetical protein
MVCTEYPVLPMSHLTRYWSHPNTTFQLQSAATHTVIILCLFFLPFWRNYAFAVIKSMPKPILTSHYFSLFAGSLWLIQFFTLPFPVRLSVFLCHFLSESAISCQTLPFPVRLSVFLCHFLSDSLCYSAISCQSLCVPLPLPVRLSVFLCHFLSDSLCCKHVNYF